MADAVAEQQMLDMPLSSEAPALTWLSGVESQERLVNGSLPAIRRIQGLCCQGPSRGQHHLLCQERGPIWY